MRISKKHIRKLTSIALGKRNPLPHRCSWLLFFLVFNLSALHSQFIAEVLEYVPAPSQYMNAAPWSTPSSPGSIIGGIHGSLSLGSFGGYVVFRFDTPVENDPDHPFGVDFTIFGNPLPNWSEPGIVSVMKDENSNGIPDDTWYELAGSDHNFSTTTKNYSITYFNPGADTAVNVPWTDNKGHTGFIKANSFYRQPYYPLQDSFPGIDTESYSLAGTMIRSTVDTGYTSGIYSLRRAFGYADNQFRGTQPYTRPDNPYTPAVENAGGDAFDISWAVDGAGNYVDLDRIHFIKVHCAVNDGAGWLGQISTEITGAAMVAPDPSTGGSNKLLVIREIPPVLDTSEYQLEVFAFSNGRLNATEQIHWTSSMHGAVVDDANILHVNSSGELTITASLVSNASISTSVSTLIDLTLAQEDITFGQEQFSVYPNPAYNFIELGTPPGYETEWADGSGNVISNGSVHTGKSNTGSLVRIYDISGKKVMETRIAEVRERLQIGHLSPGVYMLNITSGAATLTTKFIKQ